MVLLELRWIVAAHSFIHSSWWKETDSTWIRCQCDAGCEERWAVCLSPCTGQPAQECGVDSTGTYSREPRELAGWEDGRPVERNPAEGLKGDSRWERSRALNSPGALASQLLLTGVLAQAHPDMNSYPLSQPPSTQHLLLSPALSNAWSMRPARSGLGQVCSPAGGRGQGMAQCQQAWVSGPSL